MELALLTREELLDRLRTGAASAVSPFFEVDVHDSWPTKGLQKPDSILVLDAEGDETAATMRAGGGTRDDAFTIDVRVAVTKLSKDPKVPRDRALILSDALKKLVRESGQPVFGVAGVRNPRVRSWRVAQHIVDRGRECDIYLTFAFTARHRLG